MLSWIDKLGEGGRGGVRRVPKVLGGRKTVGMHLRRHDGHVLDRLMLRDAVLVGLRSNQLRLGAGVVGRDAVLLHERRTVWRHGQILLGSVHALSHPKIKSHGLAKPKSWVASNETTYH